MRAETRYNLERNAGFNRQRTAEDRRVYRAIMRDFSRAEAKAAPDCRVALTAQHEAYLKALLLHGNKAASFPSFAEWASNPHHPEPLSLA